MYFPWQSSINISVLDLIKTKSPNENLCVIIATETNKKSSLEFHLNLLTLSDTFRKKKINIIIIVTSGAVCVRKMFLNFFFLTCRYHDMYEKQKEEKKTVTHIQRL